MKTTMVSLTEDELYDLMIASALLLKHRDRQFKKDQRKAQQQDSDATPGDTYQLAADAMAVGSASMLFHKFTRLVEGLAKS